MVDLQDVSLRGKTGLPTPCRPITMRSTFSLSTMR